MTENETTMRSNEITWQGWFLRKSSWKIGKVRANSFNSPLEGEQVIDGRLFYVRT